MEPGDDSEAFNSKWTKFLIDISYVIILLEGIQRLDSYGIGTSYETVQDLIDGFEFSYDPIYKVLNEDYGYSDIKRLQMWLSKEFGILNSMNVDELIGITKERKISTLVSICKTLKHTYKLK